MNRKESVWTRPFPLFVTDFKFCDLQHTSIDFSLTSQLGTPLGALLEKFLDFQRGSVLTYSLDGKTVAKARRWTKPDGMERIIIEDGRSLRIASIEQTIP